MKKIGLFLSVFLFFSTQAVALMEVDKGNARFQIISSVVRVEMYKKLALNPTEFDLQIRFEGARLTGNTPTHQIILEALENTIFTIQDPCNPTYLYDLKDTYSHKDYKMALHECKSFGGQWTTQNMYQPEVSVIIEYIEEGNGRFKIVAYFPITKNEEGRGEPRTYRVKDNKPGIERVVEEKLSYDIYRHLYDYGLSLDPYGSYIDSVSWKKKYYK